MGSSVSVAGPRYALGIAALLVIVASLALAAVRIRRHWLPDWTGPLARLAEIVIALALLTAVMEILGAVGLFRLIPLVLAPALIAVITLKVVPGDAFASPRGARGRERASRERPAAAIPLCTAGVLAAAVVAAEWAGPTFSSYDFGIRTFDSLWYHLPWAAAFAQSGQITTLHFTDVEYLTAFYPATAELFHGLGIVLFTRDILSPALNLVWLGLVLLAGYCVGRPRGVGALTPLGAALAMATPMLDFSQAGSAANDVVGVFFVLAAVALWLGGARSGGARSGGARTGAGLAVAATALGLAVSVKLSMLGPALALTVGVLVLAPPGRRRSTAVTWFAALLLGGGFWYVRNVIAVGNPLPWVNLPGLAVPAATLQAHTGFSIAHYLVHPHVWAGVLEHGLASGFGPWWWAILAAVLIGPVLCLLPGAESGVRMLGLVALASIVAYLITPETAAGPGGHPLGFAFNLRYCAPALTLSLVALPIAPAFAAQRMRLLLAGVLGVILIATLAQGRLWPERQLIGQLLVALAIVVAIAVTLLLRRTPPRAGMAFAAGAALALLVAVGSFGYLGQRSYLRSRYAFQPGVSQLARLWAFFRRVHHARVGLVGTFGGFFSYPLYGVDDSNRVQYVALRGAHGSFTSIGSCPVWRSTVNALHLRYLVTTPDRDPWQPKRLSSAPQEAWTATDAGARAVYRRRVGRQVVAVYALRAPLNPQACPATAAG